MNKKIMVITLLSIVTGLVIFNIANQKENAIKETEKPITNSNMLTMMLETEAGTGNYEEVKQSEWPQDGYVFNASLSRCENGGTLSWDEEAKKVIMKSNTSDKCYIYFDIYVEPTLAELCNEKTFSNCIKENVFTEDGVNGLYYHDGVGTYTNASEEAGDNSYRYSGANPNNYVCFGSDATICPNDNLYRIIGLFDDDKDGTYNIKLIKYDYVIASALGTNGDYYDTYENTGHYGGYHKGQNSLSLIGTYFWNYSWNNIWSESELNKINLNTNYWNSLGSHWQEMIAITSWKVGGNTLEKIYEVSVKNTYQNEIVRPAVSTTYSSRVALMYTSDYGYASAPENWQLKLNSEEYDSDAVRSNNWMYMGLQEWTITRNSEDNDKVFVVENSGYVYRRFSSSDGTDTLAARPVFYLKSNVNIADGTGILSDPYRLSIV